MATRKTVKKKGNIIQVDFTGVESGGGVVLPEGPIQLEVSDISQEVGQDSGAAYLAFEFTVSEGQYEGKKVWDNMSLSPKALWKLRGFLEAAEFEVEGGIQDIDLDELIGLNVTAEISHEMYQGKKKNRVTNYINSSAEAEAEEEVEEEAEEEEEKPAKRGRGRPAGSGKKKPKPAEEEEEAEVEEEGEDDEPAFKVKQKVKFKDGKTTITGVITELDGDNVTVKAGSDEYEMGVEDIEAA